MEGKAFQVFVAAEIYFNVVAVLLGDYAPTRIGEISVRRNFFNGGNEVSAMANCTWSKVIRNIGDRFDSGRQILDKNVAAHMRPNV